MNKVTIKDVAKKAGVSIATVSNVLNSTGRVAPETTLRVQQVIEELQFYPSTSARSLKDKGSHLIAVLVPFSEKARLQDNPFYWQLVAGIEQGARNQQLHVMLVGLEPDKNLSFIRERHLDGVIVVGTYKEYQVVDQILAMNVPCVFMDSYLSDPKLYQVCLDDEMGGYLGTKHLIGLNHKRIALLSGKFRQGGVNHERWQGYCRALEESGIPYDPEIVFEEPVSAFGGYQIAQKVGDKRNRITAIFVFSDIGAMGLIKGLHELGLSVPHDISVVGFDDISYSNFIVPPLTTVHQDILYKGQTAVRLLLNQIKDENSSDVRKVVLPVSLVVRKSTEPCRQ